MWTIKAAHLKAEVETIQLKVMSTCEMNTMAEQTWVITKALRHKTFFSLLDKDHMNNDQVQKSKEVENKVNNQ
jgi:1,2-phenylacetyl-CoA epoxidase PaaB subunit